MTSPRRYYPLPRRLTPLAAPGSMLKRFAPPAPRPRKDDGERDPAYLAQVRECPCLSCGLDPCGEAAHLRLNSALYNKRQAMAKKSNDSWVTPLCSSCHVNDRDSQHKVGEEVFWERLGLNPFLACQRLYAARTDLVRMRAVAYVLISERQR
jgi:hypothetical protein